MNTFELLKEYQGLVGTFLGSFLAIISSIFLWSLKQWYDRREETKDYKKEIERIFLAALRECDDSADNLKFFVNESKKKLNFDTENLDIVLPPRLNRIYVNEDRLMTISKNFHHVFSQQIDIASSAVKKFNGWLEQYERMPELIFEINIKILQAGFKSKEKVIVDYHSDLKEYFEGIKKILGEPTDTIKLQLLRPVSAVQLGEHKLMKLFFAKKLDSALDSFSATYLKINEDFVRDF